MNFKKLFTVLALSLVVGFTFAGCDDEGLILTEYYTATNTLYVDAFGLNSDENLFYKFDDTEKTVSFAGEISGDPDFSQESLIFAVQIIESGSWGKTIGKFITISITDNDGSVCKMASAYSVAEDAKNECDTAEEALTLQTVEDGYFGYYGDYLKQ